MLIALTSASETGMPVTSSVTTPEIEPNCADAGDEKTVMQIAIESRVEIGDFI